MNTFICAEIDSIAMSPRGTVTGNVWLIVDGKDFPAHQWNDFIVVILGWWAAALLRLLQNSRKYELIHFMDGPYVVEVSYPPGGLLHFRALVDGHRLAEKSRGQQSAETFLAELVSHSGKVLHWCRQHNGWSDDAERLNTSTLGLKEFIRRNK
jgi:hypothetical protein